MEETVGPVSTCGEGTTSRVTAADRPYCEFYYSYSVSPENFGYHLVSLEWPDGTCIKQRDHMNRHNLIAT